MAQPTRSQPGNSLGSTLPWVLLAVLVAGTTWFRLSGVTENGIAGSDTFFYWEVAHHWEQGDPILNPERENRVQYFRPTLFALYALGLKVFDDGDHALRLVVGLFETANVVLVFLLGWLLWRNGLASLVLAGVYSLTPSVINLSRTELAHTPSVTFALLACLAVFLALQAREPRRQKLWILASGAALGITATVHPSAAFFGPILGLILALQIKQPRAILRAGGIFLGGFLIPFALWGAILGYQTMYAAVISMKYIKGPEGVNRFLEFFRFLQEGGSRSLSPFVMILFYGSLGYFLWLALRRRESLQAFLPPLLVLGYLGVLTLLARNFPARLFLPINPLVYLTILGALLHLLRQTRPWVSGLSLTTAGLLMVAFTLPREWEPMLAYARGEQKSAPRAVFDLIGDQVHADRQLLVAPSLAYYFRAQYQARPYFGENAPYLIECESGTLEEYVQERKIGFVLISTDIDPRILTNTMDRFRHLGNCLGMDKSSFLKKKEMALIQSFLTKKGARKLSLDPSLGELFALP